MSAFMCSRETFIAIARAYESLDSHGGGSIARIQLTAKKLYDANVASLRARYGSKAGPLVDDLWTVVTPREIDSAANHSPGRIAKACDCFDYQACEVDAYESSEAARIVHGARTALLRQVCGAEYENAPWGSL